MKVLVTGDREWDDVETVVAVLSLLPKGTVVVHGAARGADTIAGLVAKELGFSVVEYPADWKKFGKSAGPIRNRQMVRDEALKGWPIELVLAFHNNLEKSKGTKDMVSVAESAGISWVLCKTEYFKR